VERVVGDEAAPDEAPQRIDGFARIASAYGLMERVKEAGARGHKNGDELFFALGQRLGLRTLLRQERKLVREKQCDAAIALADGLNTGPCYLARSNQRVQTGGCVFRDARGKNG
jgi:hypothetical protein